MIRAAVLIAAACLAAVASPAAARTRATLQPTPVTTGGSLLVQGSGWAPLATVTILVGPPRSEALPVRRLPATRAGGFRVRVPVAAGADPGPYVMLVCQRSCRVKVTLPFRIVRR